MKNRYNVLLHEVKWNNFLQYIEYKYKMKSHSDLFCVVLPPPNITGTLHLGHAFQCTLMDFLIRHNKIIGKCVFWQGGVDHAGIATQVLVERNLLSLGYSKRNYTRFNFIEFVWFWKMFSHDIIISQMKCLSIYINWATFRFTLDKSFSDSVKEAFVTLYENGTIYEGELLVNWDIVLKTAVSDLEVNYVEEEKLLWFICYTSVSLCCRVVVATTRPETIFVDSAIAVNPDDIRYNRIIGTYVRVPVTNLLIPLIGDSSVSLFFGSGCVKITPAHDFNDYKLACLHFLRSTSMYSVENFIVYVKNFTKYNGIKFCVLKNSIGYELMSNNYLCFIKRYIALCAVGERTGASIEPVLSKQWFVAVQKLYQDSVISIQKNEVCFFPKGYKKTYLQWLSKLEDWCISRQIWWGHRIPAWRDVAANKVYVGCDENSIRETYSLCNTTILIREVDVLDTWFSSALWPFAVLGWPRLKQSYVNFYPLSVLITGYDILFFWVARMIMFGLALTSIVPFRVVFVHGLVNDVYGMKMSKSKGNTIDPVDIINGVSLKSLLEKCMYGISDVYLKKHVTSMVTTKFPKGVYSYGIDALRASLCASAVPGRSVFFNVANVEIFRNFCTKVWNIGRFLLTQLKHGTIYNENIVFLFTQNVNNEICLFNDWVFYKWVTTKYFIRENIKIFRFDVVIKLLSNFVFNILSNVYLELCKYTKNLYSSGCKLINIVFFSIFFDFLIVAHPILPCITTELWCNLYRFYTKRKFEHIIESYFIFKGKKDIMLENIYIVGLLLDFVKSVRVHKSRRRFKNTSLCLKVCLECKTSYVVLKYRRLVEILGDVKLFFIKTTEKPVKLLFFLSGVGCYMEAEETELLGKDSDNFYFKKNSELIYNNLVYVAQMLTDVLFLYDTTQKMLTDKKNKFIAFEYS